MRKIVILLSIFTACKLSAEPKQLVCTTTLAEEKARLIKLLEESKSEKSEFGIQLFSQVLEDCKSGEFGHKKVFSFDTDILKKMEKGVVDVVEIFNCGKREEAPVKGIVFATPTQITFEFIDDNPRNRFNVDRKTLKAGRDTSREFKCEIKKIDTSNNLI